MNLEIFVKGYGFLSFAKNIGTNETKVAKNMSNKYSQKLLDSANKSLTDTIKSASKKVIQKSAETTGGLIGNKIADKVTIILKSSKEFHSQNVSKELHSKTDENEIDVIKSASKKVIQKSTETTGGLNELR